MKNIVIVGAGLSGYLLLINLLRFQGDSALKVILIEKEAIDRLGVAYSTTDEDHLLNVSAGNMSVFSDQKEHFSLWLAGQSPGYSANSFVPRNIYRLYVLSVFNGLMEEKKANMQVVRLQMEVVDVDMIRKEVLTSERTAIAFDQLIMATGTLATNQLPLQDKTYMQTPGYFHSAWDKSWKNYIKGNETILIVGTGLTMADTLISLQKTRHSGQVIALSRHGLLPSIHKKPCSYPDFKDEMLAEKTALGMLKVVRSHIYKAKSIGSDWQAVIDTLRPYTSQLWQQLSEAGKKIFMEHLRPYWDVCRHRMPETCAEKVSAALLKAEVNIMPARITEIQVMTGNRFKIAVRKRGTEEIQEVIADVIINCMGPQTNYNRITQELIKNLLHKKLMRTDPLCLGMLCNEEGALIGTDGLPSDCLHTLGAPAKGLLWETTALPEIRVQAYRLARKILEPVKIAELSN